VLNPPFNAKPKRQFTCLRHGSRALPAGWVFALIVTAPSPTALQPDGLPHQHQFVVRACGSSSSTTHDEEVAGVGDIDRCLDGVVRGILSSDVFWIFAANGDSYGVNRCLPAAVVITS